jgi:hypothetical protein
MTDRKPVGRAILFALRQVIAADAATALMARLLRLRLLAAHRALARALVFFMRRIVSGAGRFSLVLGLVTLLELVASLLIHERISFFVHPDIATLAMPRKRW